MLSFPAADWGPKNFIAQPKNTHFQTPFCMPECAKIHVQQSRISKFYGEDPLTPSSRGGEGKGKEGKGKGVEGWGQGREGGREGRNGVVGRGGEGRSTWAPPLLETSSGSAPGRFQQIKAPSSI